MTELERIKWFKNFKINNQLTKGSHYVLIFFTLCHRDLLQPFQQSEAKKGETKKKAEAERNTRTENMSDRRTLI